MHSNAGIKQISIFVFSFVICWLLPFVTHADPQGDLKGTFENHRPLKAAPTDLRVVTDAAIIREMAQEDGALAYFVVGLPDIVSLGFSGSGSIMTRVPASGEDIVSKGLAIHKGTQVVPLSKAIMEVSYSADINENHKFTKMDVLIQEIDRTKTAVPGTTRVYQLTFANQSGSAGNPDSMQYFRVTHWRKKAA